jgi:hypothetical protein
MNGEQLYYTLSNMDLKDKRAFLATLSDNDKLLYKRHSNKVRQQKFNEKPENKSALNAHRKEYIAKQRLQKLDEFRKQNIKDVKAFREREKTKLNEIQAKVKATNTLTDAIKARKARAEMRSLKSTKANKDVKDILNSIIDTIPKQAELKQKREYMTRYRKKKAEGK